MISGCIGPRGDGYVAGTMDPVAAEDYHTFQAEAFAATAADMVSAITMNTIGEAIGIARAARAQGLPCVVSFTVETDGRLVGGASLREAFDQVTAEPIPEDLLRMIEEDRAERERLRQKRRGG